MTSLGASATCGAGQAKAAAATKNKDEATGWLGGTVIHRTVPEAAGEEAVGVFQAQRRSLQTPLPTPRQLSILPLAKEASGGRGRRSKDARVGVCRPVPESRLCGADGSVVQETSYLGACDLTGRRKQSSGQRLGSAHRPRERRVGAAGLGEAAMPPTPALLKARAAGQGEGHQAFHGYKQPSNPGRSGGDFLLPHLLAEPQHS